MYGGDETMKINQIKNLHLNGYLLGVNVVRSEYFIYIVLLNQLQSIKPMIKSLYNSLCDFLFSVCLQGFVHLLVILFSTQFSENFCFLFYSNSLFFFFCFCCIVRALMMTSCCCTSIGIIVEFWILTFVGKCFLFAPWNTFGFYICHINSSIYLRTNICTFIAIFSNILCYSGHGHEVPFWVFQWRLLFYT